MKSLKILLTLLFVTGTLTMAGCSSTTEGGAVGVERKQLNIIPDATLNQMSAQGYEQTKKEAASKNTLDVDPAQYARVKNIADRLIPHVQVYRKDAAKWAWEVHVIKSDELNAYCMPGGKIMFYSGIIDKINMTDDEIAAVMGHEMAHALREHGGERASQALLSQAGLAVAVMSGKLDAKYAQVAGALVTGAVLLPNSRGQESEADQMGIELAARAGFNPAAAITLWQKMGQQGGAKPPEFMSTHPSDKTRIAKIQSWLPKVTPLYDAAKK